MLVSKKLNGKRRRTLNPLVLLDYRCYAEGGAIGTAFPPDVAQVGGRSARRQGAWARRRAWAALPRLPGRCPRGAAVGHAGP